MKILAISKLLPGVELERLQPFFKSEAEHAWRNYECGIFRELYMIGDRRGAVIILECSDTEEAKAIMGELPLVKEKLIDFDYIPLTPFIPFTSLFGK
ncbi:MAG: superoxide dismutase [Spirochaetes bacterium GWF1_51_8]|nr:MAG: superoxide dismutase [Spirochaetes bacterium GWF1_51_8]